MERKGLHSAGIRKKYGKYFLGASFILAASRRRRRRRKKLPETLLSDADVAERNDGKAADGDGPEWRRHKRVLSCLSDSLLIGRALCS